MAGDRTIVHGERIRHDYRVFRERIGRLEPGFEGDCVVVRPESWIDDLPPEQQVSALLYTISPEQIAHVFIAGERVGPR